MVLERKSILSRWKALSCSTTSDQWGRLKLSGLFSRNTQMSDQDSSTSASQSDGELDDVDDETQLDGETEEDETEKKQGDQRSSSRSSSPAGFSSSLLAVIRIKQKYQALKRRRQELALASGGGPGTLTGAPLRSSPKIFTFDGLSPSGYGPTPTPTTACTTSTTTSAPQKKKRRRKRRVLFPSSRRHRTPPRQDYNRAKSFLYLLLAIVFVQVYNAIENLDDHVVKYDLEGLEKSMKREVFGQQGAVDGLISHLKDYLSTYVHNKPLVLSLHGPTGVGKSHLGRLLAGHFRSMVGDPLVMQYYVLHHCPQEAIASYCARNLSATISEMVERGEEEEKIPVFIFDEVEHMHQQILDALWHAVSSKQSNEYLNAIYLLLGNLGQEHIARFVLHNASRAHEATTSGHALGSVVPLLRDTLEKRHLLWTEAEILPLGLLEKEHVMECFLDEMTQEGFYPDQNNIERLAAEVEYYPEVGGRQYCQTGCKQVVAKVNLL